LIASFANEEHAMERYEKEAEKTREVSIVAAKMTGFVHAMFNTFMFAFNFWSYLIASTLIYNGYNNPGTGEPYNIVEIVMVTQCTIMCMFTTGMIVPIIPGVMKGLQAGFRIFAVIERMSEVKEIPNATTDVTIKSSINFENVVFKYPKMPEGSQNILENASFKINAGTSTAIVGPSGSGKSTIV
jgi:ABC-type multidrug transport system fused ATPase/permease subunit